MIRSTHLGLANAFHGIGWQKLPVNIGPTVLDGPGISSGTVIGTTSGEGYVFVCSSCEETSYVDEQVRETLLEEDCFRCGAAVSSGDFERLP